LQKDSDRNDQRSNSFDPVLHLQQRYWFSGENIAWSEVLVHIVAIYGWKEKTTELAQAISKALGITIFEVQQRMIRGSPIVVACFADPQQALALKAKLNQNRIATLIVDATEVRSRTGYFVVRRFRLNKSSLGVETGDGQHAMIPYEEIDMLLPGMSIVKDSETTTVTKRKFSLGKTIIAGGIPMSKKVEYQKETATTNSRKILYLYAGRRQQPVVFNQEGMTYDGLGSAMETSGERNFTTLTSELHRLSPGAVYDDRLLQRIEQVRLLGSTLGPENNLDLAVEILARSLRPSPKSNDASFDRFGFPVPESV
jgi:hypothetical protein